MPLRRRPLYVAAFAAALALAQLTAFAVQFKRGFRPFGAPPTRVPLSWDMFAIPIERCTVAWEPPVEIGGRPVPSLRALSPLLEWDLVTNTAEYYGQVGRWGCGFARSPTKVRMLCFGMDGQERRYGFDCR